MTSQESALSPRVVLIPLPALGEIVSPNQFTSRRIYLCLPSGIASKHPARRTCSIFWNTRTSLKEQLKNSAAKWALKVLK